MIIFLLQYLNAFVFTYKNGRRRLRFEYVRTVLRGKENGAQLVKCVLCQAQLAHLEHHSL